MNPLSPSYDFLESQPMQHNMQGRLTPPNQGEGPHGDGLSSNMMPGHEYGAPYMPTWDPSMDGQMGMPGMMQPGHMPPQMMPQKLPPQGQYVSHYPGPPIQTSKSCQGPDGCNLFIFHIPNDLTNLDLYNLFLPFGNVISARIMVENETGRSRGFGFVSFDNHVSADNAIKGMNGYQLGRKRLKVQHKKERHDNQQGYPARIQNPAYLPQAYPGMPYCLPPHMAPPQQQPQQTNSPQQRRNRRKDKQVPPNASNPSAAPGPRMSSFDKQQPPDASSLLLESALSSLSLNDFDVHLGPTTSSDKSESMDRPLQMGNSPTSISQTTNSYDPWGSSSPSAFFTSSRHTSTDSYTSYDFTPTSSSGALEPILFEQPPKSQSISSEDQIRELQKKIQEQSAMLQGQNELLQQLLSSKGTPDAQGSPSSLGGL